MFVGESTGTMFQNIIKVAVVTPFFFIGFDVIPQAAEEINVPLKKIGKMMILSVVLAVVFYSCVILAVGYVLNPSEILSSEAGTGLVTAMRWRKRSVQRLWQKSSSSAVCAVSSHPGTPL